MKSVWAIGLAGAVALGAGAASASTTLSVTQFESYGCIPASGVMSGGVNSCNLSGIGTLTAAPGTEVITRTTYRGAEGIGVGQLTEDDRDRELQGYRNETLTFAFDLPTVVSAFSLAHFYNSTTFGPNADPNEKAIISATAWDGTNAILTIQNTGYEGSDGTLTPTFVQTSTNGFTATVFGQSFAGNVGNYVNDQGIFNITNFFPQLGALRTLVFSADATRFNNDGSDYSLKSITVSPIPLPAAGWLLLAALGGLGVAARRKRKMAA